MTGCPDNLARESGTDVVVILNLPCHSVAFLTFRSSLERRRWRRVDSESGDLILGQVQNDNITRKGVIEVDCSKEEEAADLRGEVLP